MRWIVGLVLWMILFVEYNKWLAAAAASKDGWADISGLLMSVGLIALFIFYIVRRQTKRS